MPQAVQEREAIAKEIGTAVRHTAVYGLGSVLAKAIGFLMLPFYTHYLSPGDYGLLEILDLGMSLFGMLLHMGIAPALLRSYGMAKTEEERRITASTAFVFAVVTGVLTFAAGVPAAPAVSRILLGPTAPTYYLLLSFGSFMLSYVANMPRTYLRAREASGAFTAIETASLIVTLGLNIYFIAFLKIGLVGILLSAIIVNGIQAVGLCAWMARSVGLHFNGSILRHMAAFGLPLILANVATFGLNCSDRFFLQHLRSLDAVGIYAVGYKFAFMLNFLLVQPFYAMWQSRMYNIHARPEHPKIYSQIFVLYSLLLVYAALALSVMSREVVFLMAGSKFSTAGTIVPVVALAYVFYGVGYFLQLGLYLTGKTKTVGIISIAAAALNLGLNYVLISYFGMMGAAWATLLGFVAIAAGSYWLSQRAMPLPLGLKRVAVAVLAAVVLYAICPTGESTALAITLIVKVACLVAFPVIVCKSGLLTEAELGTIASAKEKTMAKVFGRLGWAASR